MPGVFTPVSYHDSQTTPPLIQEIATGHLHDPTQRGAAEAEGDCPQDKMASDASSEHATALPLPLPSVSPSSARTESSDPSHQASPSCGCHPRVEELLRSTVKHLDHAYPRLDPFPTKGDFKRAASGMGVIGKHFHNVIGRAAGSLLVGSADQQSSGSHVSLLETRVTRMGSDEVSKP